MPSDIQDVRLVVTIENKRPIELIDLTRSLVALSVQFDRFVTKHGDSKENREAKLYVKEIRSGSVVVELIELATVGMIPFAENVNTIVDFAKYLKVGAQYLLGNIEGNNSPLALPDYRDFSALVNPVAKDNGAQLNVSAQVNGDVHLHFNLSSIESNAMQNAVKREIEKLRVPELDNDTYERVLLMLWQARGDVKSNAGNKAVIEEISEKPMNILFDSEELKSEMLRGDINPFNRAFVVDVKIQKIQGVPRVYKILRMHEYFDLDNT